MASFWFDTDRGRVRGYFTVGGRRAGQAHEAQTPDVVPRVNSGGGLSRYTFPPIPSNS